MRFRGGALRVLVLSSSSLLAQAGTASKFDVFPVVLKKGKVRLLVIPVRFSDHGGRGSPPQKDLEFFLNSKVKDPILARKGSVSTYIRDTTYQELDIEFVLADEVTVQDTELQAASLVVSSTAGIRPSVYEALDQIYDEDNIDFDKLSKNETGSAGYIQGVLILHTGFAAEHKGLDCRGWSSSQRIGSHASHLLKAPWESVDGKHKLHAYAITSSMWGDGTTPIPNVCNKDEINRNGVVAHEVLHVYGLVDLYDGDGGGNGLGNYDIMAMGSWGYRDKSAFDVPSLSMFSKYRGGLVVPTEITSADEDVELTIKQSNLHKSAYIIRQGMQPGEYLLIENRQPTDQDFFMPEKQGGLVIYYVDENERRQKDEGYPNMPLAPGEKEWPYNQKHYRVSILQADGRYDLEKTDTNNGDAGDLFRRGWIDSLGQTIHGVDGPYPNTDSLSAGKLKMSKVLIYRISESGPEMTFKVSFKGKEPKCKKDKTKSKWCKKAKKDAQKWCPKKANPEKHLIWEECPWECNMCEHHDASYPPVCRDDPNYRHGNVPAQDCNWLKANLSNYCNVQAANYAHNSKKKKIKDFCRISCNKCGNYPRPNKIENKGDKNKNKGDKNKNKGDQI